MNFLYLFVFINFAKNGFDLYSMQCNISTTDDTSTIFSIMSLLLISFAKNKIYLHSKRYNISTIADFSSVVICTVCAPNKYIIARFEFFTAVRISSLGLLRCNAV
jgi:hypothetical protein